MLDPDIIKSSIISSDQEDLQTNRDLTNISTNVVLRGKAKNEYKSIPPLNIVPLEHDNLFYGYRYIYPNGKITELYLNKPIDTSFTQRLEDPVLREYRNPNVTYWRLGIPSPLYYRDDISPGKYQEEVRYQQPELLGNGKHRINNTLGYFNYVMSPSGGGVVRHGLAIIKRKYPPRNLGFIVGEYIYIMYNYGIPTLIVSSNASIRLSFDIYGFPTVIYVRYDTTHLTNSDRTYFTYHFNRDQPYLASLRIINQQLSMSVLFNVNIDRAGYSDFIYYQDVLITSITRRILTASKGHFVDYRQILNNDGDITSLYQIFTKRNGLYDLTIPITYNLNIVEGIFLAYYLENKYWEIKFIWGDIIASRTLFNGTITTNNISKIPEGINTIRDILYNINLFPKEMIQIIINYAVPGDYNKYLVLIDKLNSPIYQKSLSYLSV